MISNICNNYFLISSLDKEDKDERNLLDLFF